MGRFGERRYARASAFGVSGRGSLPARAGGAAGTAAGESETAAQVRLVGRHGRRQNQEMDVQVRRSRATLRRHREVRGRVRALRGRVERRLGQGRRVQLSEHALRGARQEKGAGGGRREGPQRRLRQSGVHGRRLFEIRDEFLHLSAGHLPQGARRREDADSQELRGQVVRAVPVGLQRFQALERTAEGDGRGASRRRSVTRQVSAGLAQASPSEVGLRLRQGRSRGEVRSADGGGRGEDDT